MNIRVRRTDPQTSVEAAESVQYKLTESRQAVLEVLKAFPNGLCDMDLIYQYRRHLPRQPLQSDSGIRSRRKELVEMGRVQDTGRTVLLASGRRSIIWKAV